jgi:tetratricopeptide (TPR) repeat protein
MKRVLSLLASARMLCFIPALILPTIQSKAEMPLAANCTGKPDVAWREQVEGCTGAIESGKYTGKTLARALTFRAQAYAQTGDLDNSLADIEQVIRLDPDDAFAFGARGDLHLVQKDYDGALADYDKAIALAPNNDLAMAGRGIVFLAKGELDRALAEFDHAVKLQPASAAALYWRGITRRQSGDAAGGEADIAAAKKIDPKVDQ